MSRLESLKCTSEPTASRLVDMRFYFILFAFTTLLTTSAWASENTLDMETIKIGVIADLNSSYGSTEYHPRISSAVTRMIQNQVDLVLSAGDMVAGQKSDLDYLAMWRAFHQTVTLPLDQLRIPLLPSPGNHDAALGRTEERTYYQNTWRNFPLERFNKQKNPLTQIQFVEGVAQNFPFYYAVRIGPALVIALDATTPGGFDQVQLKWLSDVLAKQAQAPLKIIFGHMPLLPFAFDRAHEHFATNVDFGKKFEDLLTQNQVQLFINGHHHAYYEGVRKGPTHFVSVPLLGSGSRYLLNRDRIKNERSQEGFLEISIQPNGQYTLRALTASTGQEMLLNQLPKAITLPSTDGKDCRKCANFPSSFFIDSQSRTLFKRR